jgi:hypothetical protein
MVPRFVAQRRGNSRSAAASRVRKFAIRSESGMSPAARSIHVSAEIRSSKISAANHAHQYAMSPRSSFASARDLSNHASWSAKRAKISANSYSPLFRSAPATAATRHPSWAGGALKFLPLGVSTIARVSQAAHKFPSRACNVAVWRIAISTGTGPSVSADVLVTCDSAVDTKARTAANPTSGENFMTIGAGCHGPAACVGRSDEPGTGCLLRAAATESPHQRSRYWKNGRDCGAPLVGVKLLMDALSRL